MKTKTYLLFPSIVYPHLNSQCTGNIEAILDVCQRVSHYNYPLYSLNYKTRKESLERIANELNLSDRITEYYYTSFDGEYKYLSLISYGLGREVLRVVFAEN